MAKGTVPTSNESLLDTLNAAVKAQQEKVKASREVHLRDKADLREAQSTRATVYKMLGLEVPDEEDSDEANANEASE